MTTTTQTPIAEKLERMAVVVADLEQRGFDEIYTTVSKRSMLVWFHSLDDFKAALAGNEVTVRKSSECESWRLELDGVEYQHNAYNVVPELPATEKVKL